MGEWVQDVLVGGGVGVLFLLVFAENLFPPIPSELILPLAGFLVSRGDIEFSAAVLAATAGSLLGAAVLYALGRFGGRPLLLRYGRILRLTDDRIDSAEGWFDDYGSKVVFFGRMVPGVRSVVSVPAGLARMPVAGFAALTVAGSAIWNTALIGAGWVLGDNWERATDLVDGAGWLLLGAAALSLVVWLAVRARSRNRA